MLKEINPYRPKPVTALSWDKVRPGDLIKTYIPFDQSHVGRVYEILDKSSHDAHDDLVISYRDYETGEEFTGPPSAIGLSLTPDGRRYFWAVPYDKDQ